MKHIGLFLVLLLFIGVFIGTAFASTWWDTNYLYRTSITITAPADQNTYTWSKLIINLDSLSLVLTGKLQSDCNDFRLIDANTSVLLDLNVVGCNTSDTNIYFGYPSRLSANGKDVNYYLYYGNSFALKYSSDRNKIETMWEPFDTNLTSDWNTLGGWSTADGKLLNTSTSGLYAMYVARQYEIPSDSVHFYMAYSTSDVGGASNNNGQIMQLGTDMNWGRTVDPESAFNWGRGNRGGINSSKWIIWNRKIQLQTTTDVGDAVNASNRATPGAWATDFNCDYQFSGDRISLDLSNYSAAYNDFTGGILSHYMDGNKANILLTSADKAALDWTEVYATYIHNTTTTLGAEENIRWWDSSWQYRQKLTLQTSKIGMSSNVTNDHVILIDINSTNTTFWTALKGDGNSIRFVNVSNTATYNWHAEDLNFDTNRLLAWVGITDTYPSATDLNLFVYYGNSAAISDQNSISTYPTTYISVWHEGERSGAVSYDALARNNGTITNALVNQANKINGGYYLDGDGDYITYANESNFDFLTNASPSFSLVQWEKTASGGTGADQMFSKYQFNGGTHLGLQTLLDNGKGQIKFWTDPSNNISGTSSQVYNDNAWHHLVFTADGNILNTSNIKFYGDTNLETMTFTTGGTYSGAANAYPLMWGKQGDYANYFKGYNDELKILNYAISQDEVKLLYNSENDLNFVIFGAQDTNVIPVLHKIDFNVYAAGTTTHLTNITADWNVNVYDVSGQNSPFSEDIYSGVYLATFSVSGYDSNTNFTIVVDTNKTYVIYLNLSIFPTYGTIDNNNIWKNFDFNIIVNDVNYLPSGKLFAKYSVDGVVFSDTVLTGATENALLNTDGNHLVIIWLRNNAGNDTNISVYGLLDKSAPDILSIDGNGLPWRVQDFNIVFDVNFLLSGDKNSNYRIDGGPWTNFNIGTDGNLFFTTGTKVYGTLSSPKDYNVSGNILTLSCNRAYTFSSFYLASGTTLVTSDNNCIAMYIQSQNSAIIDGNVWLVGNGVLGDFNFTWNGLTQAHTGIAGDGGNGYWNTIGTIGLGRNGFGGGGNGGGGTYTGGAGANGGYPAGSSPNVCNNDQAHVTNSAGGSGTATIGQNCSYGAAAYSINGNDGCGGGSCEYGKSASGAGGSGGSSGKSGVHFYIQANIINFTGTITTDGNNGGIGGIGGNGRKSAFLTPADMGGAGGAGGGAGGSGGNIYFYYITSNLNIGIINANGGAGGNGGVGGTSTGGYPDGNTGTNGTTGSAGSTISSQILSLTYAPITGLAAVPITTDGNHLVDYNFTDNAGNSTIGFVYGLLDKTAPTVTISGNTYATWTNIDQTITLIPTDGISGIVLTQYSLDGAAWINYTVPFVISIDLNHTIDFNTRDNAGNTSGIQTSWAAIDKTPPTVGPIFNALEWVASPFYVVFTQINTGISGLFHIWQSINGGAYTDANLNGTDSNGLDINAYVRINVDGNYFLQLWIRDNAGNDTNLTTYGALDQNKPTYGVIDGNNSVKIADFNVTVHDVNYMPAGKMFAKYSINSGAFIDTITADANEYALVTLDGNTSVRFWLRDNAGNDTNIQVYALLDKTAPTYSFVDGNGLPWKNYVFNITVADVNFGVSGFKAARYQIDSNTGPWLNMSNFVDSNYFVVINQDANHAVYIWLQDGNNHDTNLLVYALSDLNGPTVLRDANFGLPWRTADFNIRIDVNFAPSGVAIAKYSMDGGTFNDWNFTINDLNFLSTITSDGNHTIRGWFKDNAGNDTNTIGQVYLDKTGPSVGATVLGAGFNVVGTQIWAVLGNGTVIGGTVSDPYSDVNTLSCEYTINNGATWLPATWNTDHCEKTGVATTPGTTPQYNTRVKDNVGNQGTGTATVVYTVDNVDPVTTDNTDTSWHGSSVTVTLSPTDAVSGVASTTYCVDDSNACVPALAYTVPVVVTCPTNGVCNRYIRYYSTDIAGNVENTKGSNAIKIDQNRPGVALTTLAGYNVYTTFINNNGTVVGGVATDYNGSGLNTATCEYTVNNGGAWAAGAWNTDHCEKTTAVAIVDGTSYQFNTRITDNVSNIGTGSATIAYTGDTLAPVTTPTGNTFATWTTVAQTITLTCVDARSGCNSIQYTVDSNGTWFTLNSAGPFTFILGTDGNHTIDFNSRDNVTNVETTKRTWAVIDVSAPIVGQTYIETTKISGVQIWGPVHLDATVSDVNGIISFCQYTINNGASWLAADLNATHCYKNGITVTAGTFPQYNLRATNLAGLTGAGTATIVYTADNVAPTVGLTTATFTSSYGTGPYYIKGTGTIVGGTATDAVSGIDNTTCEYRDTNTGTWAAGTWNVNHCEKVGWAAGVNGLSYYFNTRINDLAGNLGTGSPSIRYTFDTNGPQVTYTYAQLVPGNPDTNVRLFCLDANSGCKYIWYNVDNTGWNRANTPSVDFNWFIVSGTGGHRIQYLGTDNLDNNSADLNLDMNVAGRLRIRIADENTGLWISNTTITFNSTVYTAVNGVQFDINLAGITSGVKTIAFSKALYGTRYYDMDMNAAGNYDVNILLLDATKGAQISFTFYMNDAVTAAGNGFADLNRPDRNGFSIGRESLNALGGAIFFVNNTDQNYTQKIITSSGDVNYSFPVYLTILFPKDEQSLLPIDNNWGFITLTNTIYSKRDINQFGGDYPVGPGGDANVYLMPNTGIPTSIEISDANGVYFPRLYNRIYLGDPRTDLLQPYLIQYLQGSNITLITTNQLGFAIPGITIEVYKTINNIETLISSGVTDNTGAYTTSLAITNTYTFKLYSNGVLVSPNPFVIQIVESKYYFTINTFGYPVDTNTIKPVQVLWAPSQEYLYGTTTLTQNISGATVNFISMQAYQYTDANNTGRVTKYAQYFTCNESCSINEALASMTLNGGLDSNLELYIDLNVYYDGNAHYQPFTKGYRMNNNPPVNLMQLFVNAKRSFGCEPTVFSICPWTTILAILLAIVAMGAIMYSLKIFNPFAMAIIGSIVIAFFTLVGWFYWILLIPFGLILIFGLFGRRGSE